MTERHKGGSRIAILVVDDEPLVRMDLAAILRQAVRRRMIAAPGNSPAKPKSAPALKTGKENAAALSRR
jgi:hypothetical protein